MTSLLYLARLGQILLDRMRQVVHAHRLKPHPSRTGQRGQEQARTAEEHVLDAGHGHDVELHRLLKHTDLARMHAQGVARLQVVDDDLTVEGNPRLPLPRQLLQPKSGAAEDARAEALLKADGELDADLGAEEAMAMDHVALTGGDLKRQDLARQLGRKGQESGSSHRRVFGHEQRAAGHSPAESTEKAALLAADRRSGLH